MRIISSAITATMLSLWATACTEPGPAVGSVSRAGGTACTEGTANGIDPATGHCYMVFRDPTEWDTASQLCASLPGDTHLAILDTEAKNELVIGLMSDAGASSAWLDGTDEAEEMDWRWSTTGVAVPDTGWLPGEPNDLLGINDCMALQSLLGGWTDERCGQSRSYVCERRAERVPDAGVADASPESDARGGVPASCSQGDANAIDPSTGYCYMYFDTRMTWSQSVTLCRNLGAGAHLATMLSEAENAFIGSGWAPDGRVWLGANDVAEEMTWTWVTGEEMRYDSWSLGEPNDFGLGGEDCLIGNLGLFGDVAWFDIRCDDTLPAICERGDLGDGPGDDPDGETSLYDCALAPGAGHPPGLWLLGLALVLALRLRRRRVR